MTLGRAVHACRYGELAVARAIGSAHIKRDPSKRALIPTPEVHSVQLQAEDDFVVLATDGLWDKVRCQRLQAQHMVQQCWWVMAGACAG